jgi:DNA/RNA endonuclease G (NUC1)
VPDALRGKVATLKFVLDGGGEVYIDNVFFKSQHLMLGNPTEARHEDAPVTLKYSNNYLLEKPQYATSYSSDGNTPNWSSWQLNQSWFIDKNTLPRPEFQSDIASPFYPIQHDNYAAQKMPDGFPIERGHLAPSADRNRNTKDNVSTYLTTNIVPQHTQNNSPLWAGLEVFERRVASLGKELYLIAGGSGEIQGRDAIDVDGNPSHDINIPEALWKVIVVMDRPGINISDINDTNTKAFAIYTPNAEPLLTGKSRPKYKAWFEGYTTGVGGAEILTIRELEQRLNQDQRNISRKIHYNFLSNLSSTVQDALEMSTFSWTGDDPINAFTGVPLLAGYEQSTSSISLVSSETAIRHPGILENSSFQVGSFQVGSFQVGSFQVGSFQVGSFQVGSPQVTTSQITPTEISSFKDGVFQATLVQTNHAEIGLTQVSSISKELIEATSSQIYPSQISSTDIKIIQVGHDKLSFTSSITFQQFLNSHNFNLQNTTIPTWTEFLTGTTPFNLNIEITDLPTGQLAEANITHFDSTGRPTSGTLTLDTDANGLGWF